jgi:hypothetical protein
VQQSDGGGFAAADAGVGLGLGKQPLEVGFQPGDEACAQGGFIGQGLLGGDFAFEDPLTQGVVQQADGGGFAAAIDDDFVWAVEAVLRLRSS